jgi:hypothetical protein
MSLLLLGCNAYGQVDFVGNHVIIHENNTTKAYDVGFLLKKGASADEIVEYINAKRRSSHHEGTGERWDEPKN